jgi:hypothetical protein
MAFADLCNLMAPVLSGPARRDIVDAAARAPRLSDALTALGESIASDTFKTGAGVIKLARLMTHFDGVSRAEGFHALHDWDGVAIRISESTIPMDVLRYVAALRKNDATDRRVLAIVLDYYFLHVLSLLSLRVWDNGDANANLDRLGELVGHLQGPNGSGQRFVSDAETLILVATSHYEPEEHGYALLLDRVRTLSGAHQCRIALGHAASMGCHLRFGFEATYGRNAGLMREDNIVDYPWLRYALVTLLNQLEQPGELSESGDAMPPARRLAIVEAIAGGLTADVPSLLADPEVAAAFAPHRNALVPQFDQFMPTPDAYSPLGFFFNFSYNLIKGSVVDAMLWGEPWPISLNELLTAAPSSAPGGAPPKRRETLAVTLMDYARKNPEKIRGKLMPVIVYDPATGARAFATALALLRPASA